MKYYKIDDIENAVRKVGIKKDDTIFINPEIYKFGILESTDINNRVYEYFYKVIKDIIGPKGTICINSYTFDTLRLKKKFYYNEPNSTCGGFSNYILSLKKTIRSDHPVFSIASIGYKSKFISQNNSLHNYGYNSPYEKFLRLNGKILHLGRDYWINSNFHTAEFMVGVPYFYNKFTKVPIIKNKKRINREYSSSVRYLNFDLVGNYNKLKKELKKSKTIKSIKLGGSFVHGIVAKKNLEVYLNLLTKDQFSLIDKKKYLKSLKNLANS